MEYKEIIIRDINILSGKPIIKGTRISVELILKKMSEGATLEDLLKGYPFLEAKQIYAALAYSSAVLANEEIFEVESQ